MSDAIDRQPIHPYRKHVVIEKSTNVWKPSEEMIARNKARREIEEMRADAKLIEEIIDGFGLTGSES